MRIRPRERRQAKVFGVDSPDVSSSEEEIPTKGRTKGAVGIPKRGVTQTVVVAAKKGNTVFKAKDVPHVSGPSSRGRAARPVPEKITTEQNENARRPRERRRAKIFGVDSSDTSSSSEVEAVQQAPAGASPPVGTSKRTIPAAKKRKVEMQETSKPSDVSTQLGATNATTPQQSATGHDSSAEHAATSCEEPLQHCTGPRRVRRPYGLADTPDAVIAAAPNVASAPPLTETLDQLVGTAPQPAVRGRRGIAKPSAAQGQVITENASEGTIQARSPTNPQVGPAAAATAEACVESNASPPRQMSLSALTHQLVVAPVPVIAYFSLHYEERIGVPFLFASGECGVWFKDRSCVLLSCEGAKNRLTYINKHHHRFSITATSEGFVAVPRRLEKKVFCALWCRQHLRSDKSAQPGTQCNATCLPPPNTDGCNDGDDGGRASSTWEQCIPMDAQDVFTPHVTYVEVASPHGDAAKGAKVTFHLSNIVHSYPHDTYYASDEEPPREH